MITTGLKRVWADQNLRKLVAARFISNFGNGLAPIAVSFGVLGLPGANGKSLSLVMAATSLALVIFSLVGGMIGDRVPRALLVGVAEILMALFAIVNGIALITGNGSIELFTLIGFASGALTGIWYPAMSSLAVDLAEPEILQESNSAVALSASIAMILGTSTGGILVATVGSGPAILIDGITFLIAGTILYSLRAATPVAKRAEDSSTWKEFVTGWREFRYRTWVFVVVLSFSFVVSMERAVYTVLGPLIAKEKLGGPKPWSLILATWAIGSVIGVLISAKIKPRYPIKVILLIQLPVFFWFFSLANTTEVLLLATFSFIVGMVFDFSYVIWVTTLQQHIPRESLSKVMAYDALGSLALAPIGIAIAGPIAEAYGTKIILDVISGLFLICVAIPLLFKDVRQTQAK